MKIQSCIWGIGLCLCMVLGMSLPVQAGEKAGLQPVDETALGSRIPLILIHGINPQSTPLYGWGGFLRATASNTEFQRRYKSYFFIYPTADSVRNNGVRLKEALLSFHNQHPNVPSFRMLALSLGGLVAKEAFRDEALRKTTDRVITLGTPFHGSPLANPEWIRAALQQRSPLHVMRMNHRLAYRITRQKFPHFEEDFHWDNFDGALPEKLAIVVAQAETDAQSADTVQVFGNSPEFYTYAGFFGHSETEEQWLMKTLQLDSVPIPSKAKRNSLISRHMAFRLAQPCLASLPISKQEQETGLSMMRFNDGISPISSQLWLGRYISAKGEITPEMLWQTAASLKGKHSARLFEGLDHRDWLTGKTRYRDSDGKVADWLHPEEAPKTVYEWLVKDLLD